MSSIAPLFRKAEIAGAEFATCNQSTKAPARITATLWSFDFSQETRAYVGPSLLLVKRWLHLTSRDANIIGNQDLIRLLQFVNEQTVEDVVKIDIKRLRFPALSHSCLQTREKLLLRRVTMSLNVIPVAAE